MRRRVYDIAHARAGDKGNSINIAVIARKDSGYYELLEYLTPEIVFKTFSHLADGPVERYELPNILSFNFLINNLKGGSVTNTLAMDTHGKSLSYLMLSIELPSNLSV